MIIGSNTTLVSDVSLPEQNPLASAVASDFAALMAAARGAAPAPAPSPAAEQTEVAGLQEGDERGASSDVEELEVPTDLSRAVLLWALMPAPPVPLPLPVQVELSPGASDPTVFAERMQMPGLQVGPPAPGQESEAGEPAGQTPAAVGSAEALLETPRAGLAGTVDGSWPPSPGPSGLEAPMPVDPSAAALPKEALPKEALPKGADLGTDAPTRDAVPASPMGPAGPSVPPSVGAPAVVTAESLWSGAWQADGSLVPVGPPAPGASRIADVAASSAATNPFVSTPAASAATTPGQSAAPLDGAQRNDASPGARDVAGTAGAERPGELGAEGVSRSARKGALPMGPRGLGKRVLAQQAAIAQEPSGAPGSSTLLGLVQGPSGQGANDPGGLARELPDPSKVLELSEDVTPTPAPVATEARPGASVAAESAATTSDHMSASERQERVEASVTLSSLRHETRVVLRDDVLGEVHINGRRRDGRVDVSVRATSEALVAQLNHHTPTIVAQVQEVAPLGSFRVGSEAGTGARTDGGGSGGNGSGNGGRQKDDAGVSERPQSRSAARVRIVL